MLLEMWSSCRPPVCTYSNGSRLLRGVEPCHGRLTEAYRTASMVDVVQALDEQGVGHGSEGAPRTSDPNAC